MSDTTDDWTGGLRAEHELFFPRRPDHPDMREGASIWLYEDKGAFAIPRLSVEAEAQDWDNRGWLANFAFPDGRVLCDAGRGAGPSPFGPDGRPSVFGAGPMVFRMVEPFRKWAVTFEGLVIDTHVGNQIAQTVDPGKRVPLKYEIELTMAAPCHVQDFSPERVARMTPEEAGDATSMGIGLRMEQLFRAEGVLVVDGATRPFTGSGLRIKRQSLRQLTTFAGHTWQSALFPDGRAFGYIAYPRKGEDVASFQTGYVFQNGRMYPARPVRVPWLRRLAEKSDDVSIDLETALGVTRISAKTALNTFRVSNPQMAGGGFCLHQGGALYAWDDQVAYGMIERSAQGDQIAAG